jgi:uncharacterized protein YwbE
VDVVLHHTLAERSHAPASFRPVHDQRLVHRGGDPVDVVRVHDQRVGALYRAATNSLLTRFIPSRSGVTSMTSAAR